MKNSSLDHVETTRKNFQMAFLLRVDLNLLKTKSRDIMGSGLAPRVFFWAVSLAPSPFVAVRHSAATPCCISWVANTQPNRWTKWVVMSCYAPIQWVLTTR